MNKILLDREQLSLYSRAYTRGIKSELSMHLSAEFHIPEDCVLLSYGSEDMKFLDDPGLED